MPVFAQAAAQLAAQAGPVTAVVPVAHAALRAPIEGAVAGAPEVDWRLIDGDARTVMTASDLLLAASGTVTLEALLLGRPMVVAYRASAFTAWLLRRFQLLRTDYVSLPNILTGSPTVPELLQEEASPEKLAGALAPLWRSSEARELQRAHFATVRGELARDAGARAAEIVGEIAGLAPPDGAAARGET